MAVEKTDMRRYVGKREILSYAVTVGGNGLAGGFGSSWGTYFYINILRVDPIWLSRMFAALGIWDTANDPMMGVIIDRTKTRFGKLKPYLVATPLPNILLAIALYMSPMLFAGASEKSVAKFAYLVTVVVIQEFLGTIGGAAYGAVVTAVSPSPRDRQALYTAGSFASFLLSGLPGMLFSLIIDLNRNGVIDAPVNVTFSTLGIASAAIGYGLFFLAITKIKERVVRSYEQPSLVESFKNLAHNRPLICLVAKGVLGMSASLGSSFGTYYYADVLGAASYRSLCGIASFIVGAFSYTLIPFFKSRWDNKQIDIMVSLLKIIAPSLTFFAGRRNVRSVSRIVPLIAIWNAVNALFDGVGSVVPSEMMAETVDYMEWKTGMRSEGITFAAANLITKLVGVLTSSMGTLILAKIGYRPGLGVGAQSAKTNQWLWALFTIIPQAFGVIDCIPILFYNLVGGTRETMLKDLTERRRKLAIELGGQANQVAAESNISAN
ncbi:MAG: hypothetical protein GX051_01925 [Clostridiales bacterium]|nr:hypothetical protein [Clostridiales bacterium]